MARASCGREDAGEKSEDERRRRHESAVDVEGEVVVARLVDYEA